MRTSNKILLGALLLSMFIVSLPVIVVRAKYASGNIEKSEAWQGSDVEHYKYAPSIKQVSVANLGNVLIVPADSFGLKIWNNYAKAIKQYVKDGVLYVAFEPAPDKRRTERNQTHVELFLPATDSLSIRNCYVVVRGQGDTAQAIPSYNIQLDSTEMYFTGDGHFPQGTRLGQLKVNATSSKIGWEEKSLIDNASFVLRQSDLKDNKDINFNKLTIQTDSASNINMRGHNLRKATITSKE